MSDAQHIIADFFKLDTDESTILRHEQLRVRCAVYEGTLDADLRTTVNLSGLKDPIIIGITAMVEPDPNSWGIYDYGCGSFGDSFAIYWNDPDHSTNPNEVVFANVGASSQGDRYRMSIFYLEKNP